MVEEWQPGKFINLVKNGQLRDYIRKKIKYATYEQKEVAFLGLHSTVVGLITTSFLSEGKKIVELIQKYPGMFVGGIIAGGVYYNILKNILTGS